MSNFADLGKAADSNMHWQYVYKTTTPAPGTAGFFVDMNQTSGIPKYNAFAGSALTFTPLVGTGNAGVYTGTHETGKTKRLIRWQVVNINTAANTVPPDHVLLCDYLGFYPLIDCDDVDVQTMDNTVVLPRYATGEGVRIAFIVTAPMASTAAITVTYTNQAGVTGRSVTFNLIPGLNIGVCATGTGTAGAVGQVTPFLPLAGNDSGVRAIESVQLAASAGGFICAALVKPIASIMTYESGVPTEKEYLTAPPAILEGAYLNFLIQRSGSNAGSLRSELLFTNVE